MINNLLLWLPHQFFFAILTLKLFIKIKQKTCWRLCSFIIFSISGLLPFGMAVIILTIFVEITLREIIYFNHVCIISYYYFIIARSACCIWGLKLGKVISSRRLRAQLLQHCFHSSQPWLLQWDKNIYLSYWLPWDIALLQRHFI